MVLVIVPLEASTLGLRHRSLLCRQSLSAARIVEKIRRMRWRWRVGGRRRTCARIGRVALLTRASSRQDICGRRANGERYIDLLQLLNYPDFGKFLFLLSTTDVEETMVRPAPSAHRILQELCRIPTPAPARALRRALLHPSQSETT